MYYFIVMTVNTVHSFSKYFSISHEPGGFPDAGDTAVNKTKSPPPASPGPQNWGRGDNTM